MSTPRRIAALFTVGTIAAVLLGACSSSGDDATTPDSTASGDRQAVVTQLVDGVIGPLVKEANTATAAARDASAAYCAAPSPETRQAALAAVDAGITAYERLDPVDMGPIMLLRTDGHVVYPVDAERVEDLLADSPATDAESINAKTPSSTRGLTAAEYLLASEPAPGIDPVRCAFLIGITADAANSVDLVVVDSFEGANGASAYYARLSGAASDAEPPKETVDVIVNMIMTVLDKDAALLADPGDQTAAVVRRAAAAHMATIGALWGDGSAGLSQLVDDELASPVADEIATAQQALDDGAVTAADAEAAVEEVRASIGTEVVSALDVVVGFSENDGDS